MKLVRLTAVLFVLIGLGMNAAAQERDFSKVQIKVHKVADGIYMLEGAGGNIGASVGEDGIVIVDDQFAPLAPKIQAALKGITDKPVRFVLNTHFHFDHTGGNLDFGKAGSTIVAHENVRKRLAAGATNKRFNITTPPAAKEALPVVTFDKSASVHLNGEDIRAIHFPNGHTDGDSVIFFTKANVVHMGDDFFNGMFPFVDTDSGGSVLGYIQAIEGVLKQVNHDTKFIPGHGPLATTEDARKYVAMLKETRTLVADAVTKKMTPEQMKANKILAKFEESYGKGFIKADDWIDTLYADVTQKKSGVRFHNHGHAHETVVGK
jgi:cyclase